MNSLDQTPGPRLAIVLSHATQYYSPWFRWLRANTELQLRVFYLSDVGLKEARDEEFGRSFAWDVDLTGGYDWEVVPNTARHPDTQRFRGLRNPDLPTRIAAWNATAILLFGYNYETHLRLIAWARLKGIPLIFRGDSHLLGRTRFPWTKRILLRCLYRQFHAITYVGRANREYFRSLGAPGARLFFAPHAVDHTLFNSAEPRHRAAAQALRAQLGLQDSTRVILFAAKLIACKRPMALMEAYLSLPDGDHALVISGDGPERSLLEERAAGNRGKRIHFLPFANQSEMPARYLLANLLALPSESETWGLSINEAMHMGIPCLVSTSVGCQQDLVTDGETGWVFDARQGDALRQKLSIALECLAEHPGALHAAVAKRMSAYTYAAATQGLLEAIAAVHA